MAQAKAEEGKKPFVPTKTAAFKEAEEVFNKKIKEKAE